MKLKAAAALAVSTSVCFASSGLTTSSATAAPSTSLSRSDGSIRAVAGARPAPVTPATVSIAVPTVSATDRGNLGLAARGDTHSRATASLIKRGVRFDVAGVTFTGRAPTGLLVEARTHSPGGWGRWVELGLDGDGPDPLSKESRGAMSGTAPLAAAGSDGIQVRASSPSGALPSGLSATLTDGGVSRADADLPKPNADPFGVPSVSRSGSAKAATAVSAPSIITRAQWGADESLRPCTPTTLRGFKAGVVHHTVNSNTYSPSQAAALMRGIYAYHTRNLGWCDIGYNFLVDRFGRIYEGRKGGITGFIQGAQAQGFNSETFGVSVIGDHRSLRFGTATLDAVTRVVRWQASRSGFIPSKNVTLTSQGSDKYPNGVRIVKARVIGHRDLNLTECPGNAAYLQVATIRARAGS